MTSIVKHQPVKHHHPVKHHPVKHHPEHSRTIIQKYPKHRCFRRIGEFNHVQPVSSRLKPGKSFARWSPWWMPVTLEVRCQSLLRRKNFWGKGKAGNLIPKDSKTSSNLAIWIKMFHFFWAIGILWTAP